MASVLRALARVLVQGHAPVRSAIMLSRARPLKPAPPPVKPVSALQAAFDKAEAKVSRNSSRFKVTASSTVATLYRPPTSKKHKPDLLESLTPQQIHEMIVKLLNKPKNPLKPEDERPLNAKKQYLNAKFKQILEHQVVVVLQHNNLTVPEWIAARAELAKANISLAVVQNKVLKSSIRGTNVEPISPLFHGPTAVAYGNVDPHAIGGLMAVVAKVPKLIVLGAKIEKSLMTTDDIKKVLALPGLDQLRAELVGTIQSPMVFLSSLLQQPAQGLALNLDQHIKQVQEAATGGAPSS